MSPLMAPRQAAMVCNTLEHSSPLSNAFSIAVIWPLILLTRFRSFSLSLVVCAILFTASFFDDTIPGYGNEAFCGQHSTQVAHYGTGLASKRTLGWSKDRDGWQAQLET